MLCVLVVSLLVLHVVKCQAWKTVCPSDYIFTVQHHVDNVRNSEESSRIQPKSLRFFG